MRCSRSGTTEYNNLDRDHSTMKKSLIAAAVAMSALFAGSAMAEGEFSFNVGATSNYMFRGVSQTDNGGAIQGGVDYTSGIFYIGGWASNVDFGSKADYEADVYFGLRPQVGNFSFDVGMVHYMYPNETDLNATEIKTAVSHPMGAGEIGAAMYLDASTLEDPYVEVFASYPLTDKFSVSGAMGSVSAGGGYTHFNFGGTYALTSDLALDVRYSEVDKRFKSDVAKPTLFATIVASF